MRLKRRSICIALFLTLTVTATTSVAQDVFALSYATRNETRLSVEGGAPSVRADERQVKEATSGGRRSECRDYGRVASAVAEASSTNVRATSSSVFLDMNASARSAGGHYRTCGACIARNCTGIQGHDTLAQASASSMLRVAIQFNEELAYNRYEVNVVTSGRTDMLSARITGPNTAFDFSGAKGGHKIKPSKGDVYFVEVQMAAGTQNSGGCCSESKTGSAGVHVRVASLPILSEFGNFEPYIIGGEVTSSFENVAAILLDGQLHCSGTVIGPRTILTAAHCLHLHEPDVIEKRMTVVFGEKALTPTSGPFIVAGLDYPRGPDIRFNPSRFSLEHDIGVVYVAETLAAKPAMLHTKEPALNVGLGTQRFTFVGYGYTRTDSGLADAGIKRQAKWPIGGMDDSRFFYQVDRVGACKGDSGGPTFMDNPAGGAQFLVGVTSGGEDSCTSGGVQTRVDAHRSWLDSRIR